MTTATMNIDSVLNMVYSMPRGWSLLMLEAVPGRKVQRLSASEEERLIGSITSRYTDVMNDHQFADRRLRRWTVDTMNTLSQCFRFSELSLHHADDALNLLLGKAYSDSDFHNLLCLQIVQNTIFRRDKVFKLEASILLRPMQRLFKLVQTGRPYRFEALSEGILTVISILALFPQKSSQDTVFIDLITSILSFHTHTERVDNDETHQAIITAKVKAMTFLAFLLARDPERRHLNYQKFNDFAPLLPNILDRPSRFCETKELMELIKSTRRIIEYYYRQAFVPKLCDLMDGTSLIGDGFTAYKYLKPVAHSMVSSLIFHTRKNLPPETLCNVLEWYSKNLLDDSMTISETETIIVELVAMTEYLRKLSPVEARYRSVAVVEAIADKLEALNMQHSNDVKARSSPGSSVPKLQASLADFVWENIESIDADPLILDWHDLGSHSIEDILKLLMNALEKYLGQLGIAGEVLFTEEACIFIKVMMESVRCFSYMNPSNGEVERYLATFRHICQYIPNLVQQLPWLKEMAKTYPQPLLQHAVMAAQQMADQTERIWLGPSQANHAEDALIIYDQIDPESFWSHFEGDFRRRGLEEWRLLEGDLCTMDKASLDRAKSRIGDLINGCNILSDVRRDFAILYTLRMAALMQDVGEEYLDPLRGMAEHVEQRRRQGQLAPYFRLPANQITSRLICVFKHFTKQLKKKTTSPDVLFRLLYAFAKGRLTVTPTVLRRFVDEDVRVITSAHFSSALFDQFVVIWKASPPTRAFLLRFVFIPLIDKEIQYPPPYIVGEARSLLEALVYSIKEGIIWGHNSPSAPHTGHATMETLQLLALPLKRCPEVILPEYCDEIISLAREASDSHDPTVRQTTYVIVAYCVRHYFKKQWKAPDKLITLATDIYSLLLGSSQDSHQVLALDLQSLSLITPMIPKQVRETILSQALTEAVKSHVTIPLHFLLGNSHTITLSQECIIRPLIDCLWKPATFPIGSGDTKLALDTMSAISKHCSVVDIPTDYRRHLVEYIVAVISKLPRRLDKPPLSKAPAEDLHSVSSALLWDFLRPACDGLDTEFLDIIEQALAKSISQIEYYTNSDTFDKHRIKRYTDSVANLVSALFAGLSQMPNGWLEGQRILQEALKVSQRAKQIATQGHNLPRRMRFKIGLRGIAKAFICIS